MNLDEMMCELSDSAKRAVLVYASALHMTESLLLPQSTENVSNSPGDPRRMPGNIDAARALRRIVSTSKEAKSVQRQAHRRIVGIAYRARNVSDRNAKRLTGDVPPREGCTAFDEEGVQCGLPIHAQGKCMKHYRRTLRKRRDNVTRAKT